jgi:acyl-CoA thioesterase II
VIDDEAALRARIGDSLDGLLRALSLHRVADDRFRAESERAQFDRLFGGQMLAQAVIGSGLTVTGQLPHSLHAYFTSTGAAEEPVEVAVERVRDGRSVSVRRVTVNQDGRAVLTGIASFHDDAPGPRLAAPAPTVAAPDELPSIQHWVAGVPDEVRTNADRWIERPPPVELRIGEPPMFFGGRASAESRAHWMRVPRDVGDDPLLHRALLAYASDYFLLDMTLRVHPHPVSPATFFGFSMDHAIWFHRPVRFDRWHLHVQDALAVAGERGLVRGSIYDDEGQLVATVMQEVLIRVGR